MQDSLESLESCPYSQFPQTLEAKLSTLDAAPWHVTQRSLPASEDGIQRIAQLSELTLQLTGQTSVTLPRSLCQQGRHPSLHLA